MSVAPPSGWSIVTGTWGIDADIVTNPALSGGHSLNLKNTAVATKVVSAWFPVTQSSEVPSGFLYYTTRVRARADSIAGGNTVTVKLQYYQSDRITLLNTTVLHSSVLAAANTWQEFGLGLASAPAAASLWGRYEIYKSATAFNAYIDFVYLSETPSYFRAFGRTATPLAIGINNLTWSLTWRSLTSLAANNYDIHMYESGLYTVSLNANFSGLADQASGYIEIQLNGIAVCRTNFSTSGTANQGWSTSGTFPVSLDTTSYAIATAHVYFDAAVPTAVFLNTSTIHIAKLR